jgi:hypothetical protein
MFHDDQVNISLNASVGQLKQTREESNQFHEANNEMVISLQAKVIHIIDFSIFTFHLVVFYEIDALLCFQHIDQFNILFSASTQENELMKCIDSCNVEAGVVKTWVNFLEDTWQLQSSYNEQKENKTKYVVVMAIQAFCEFQPIALLLSHLPLATLRFKFTYSISTMLDISTK